MRTRIEVHGTVQGVGFRPFVYRLAKRHALNGWVLNAGGGVHIEVEGPASAIEAFQAAIRSDAPPLARVERVTAAELPPAGLQGFEIRGSQADASRPEPVPPDTATCDDCLRELFDPADRRYRYPFINCTNCGPRFTVIEGLPYDRALTTMRGFTMCHQCAREYHDPTDRRFHAQPNACPVCGPRLWLELAGGAQIYPVEQRADVIDQAVRLLHEGRTLAIKALGGFHLACDAHSEAAVAELRRRKRRGRKPFAVMFSDIETVQAVCEVSQEEAALLGSARRPIVLVSVRQQGSRSAAALAGEVAPGLQELGAMLASTPLHHLLLRAFGGPLVMTSGNLSEEPISAANGEALDRLSGIAGAFLLHDRDIASRYDDSVVRIFRGATLMSRRARGYAPEPLPAAAGPPVLACGAHLKSTFCLADAGRAYVSQHLGDLENVDTLEHYRQTLRIYQKLFAIQPRVVAHDLHPEYLSTKFAQSLTGVRRVAVQHHHAHIASCLAEHGQKGPAIGVAYDGLGYGLDGHLWGGEFLLADLRAFKRAAHFREAPMPGGEAAIRKPYRMALGYLLAWFGQDLTPFAPFLDSIPPQEMQLLSRQVARGLNAPQTSSCGRLFDAVSALLGVCREAQYEGQAAMELQGLADPLAEGQYPYEVNSVSDGEELIIDPAPVLAALYADHRRGVPVGAIAMRFHRTIAAWTADVCRRLAEVSGVRQVALGGGVFQNTLLLEEVLQRIPEALYPRRLPPNDGGLSFGQTAVALSLTGGDG